MHATVAEVVRAALEDKTIGVNALIADVPRVSGQDEPPHVVEFVSVFDDKRVARGWPPGGSPKNWPALIVGPDRPARTEGEAIQGRIDAEGLGIGITYATNRKNPARAMADGSYTIRAAGRTLTKLLEDANSDMREKNNLQVFNALDRQVGSFSAKTDQGRVTAGLTVRLNVRDLAPGG